MWKWSSESIIIFMRHISKLFNFLAMQSINGMNNIFFCCLSNINAIFVCICCKEFINMRLTYIQKKNFIMLIFLSVISVFYFNRGSVLYHDIHLEITVGYYASSCSHWCNSIYPARKQLTHGAIIGRISCTVKVCILRTVDCLRCSSLS